MADVGREQRWRTSATLSAGSPKTGLICAVLLTKHTRVGSLSRSSRGLGHRPFTAATGVRIPYGMPTSNPSIDSKTSPRPSPAGGCFFVSVQIQSRFCLLVTAYPVTMGRRCTFFCMTGPQSCLETPLFLGTVFSPKLPKPTHAR